MNKGTIIAQMREWASTRPQFHGLILRFPPSCKVTSHEDAPLLVPAPGIVGTVTSYYDNGMLGVIAPLQEEVAGLERGRTVRGECDPDNLVFLEEGLITREDVEKALEGL